jgi:hypothetical protein
MVYPIEAVLEKKELNKLIKEKLPHTKIKRWEQDKVIVNIDASKLKREKIGDNEILKPNKAKIEYVVCKNKEKTIVIVQ